MFLRCYLLHMLTASLLTAPDAVVFAPEEIDVAPPRMLTLTPIDVLDSDSEVRKLLKKRYNAVVAEMKDKYHVNG